MKFAALPWSFEVEAVVIGAALIDPAIVGQVGPLSAEDFGDALHRRIWSVIAELHAGPGFESSVDVWSVLEAAGASSELRDRMADCEESTPSPKLGRHYAALVRKQATMRRFATACGSTYERAQNVDPQTLDAFVREAYSEIRDAAEAFDVALGTKGRKVGDAMADEIEALQRRIADPGDHRRLSTGWPDVDRLVIGLEPADYVIVAARPSMGKTALVLQLAANVCKQGGAVSLFSIEQSTPKIMQRMLAQESEVDFGAIRTGRDFGDRMVDRIIAAQDRISRWNLSIRDDPSMTPSAIRSAIASDKAARGCDLVIIDHLHDVRPDVRNDSRYVQVSDISQALKATAKDFDVPLVLAAQLSRDAHDPKRPPSLKALRDSGRIEEHGDIIALLHRDDYYNADTRPGEADLMIAKCRDGETGRVTLTWRPNCLRFDSHRFGP